ncbi:MAG: ABC transporter ATP-binding protein [Eubacterium sp.]
MKQKEKSATSWLAEFAGEKKNLYVASVLVAILGVACSVVPYVIMGDIVAKLIGGNRDWQFYLKDGAIMAIFWLGRVVFHGISTSYSHKATFYVLATIRKRLCDKLARVPLGQVKDTPSGTLKNIMVERVDSIETTLAHVLPEFTANLLAPLAVFVYLLLIDWRMALVSLITLVIGMFAYMGMMIGYEESYQNTVDKTKILNDTAVEYINGIEVIKAFGKAQNSYERFEIAAKEGADCYVEWMRRCNVFFSIGMVLMPCTTIAVLPIGGIFFMNGSLALADLIMCLILSLGLVSPLITVMSYSDDLGKMGTIVGEVTSILSWEELERPMQDQEKMKDYSIDLCDVTFGYHEKEVLHGINMQIKEGTVNALVGPSGSGKSTIAKLIASLWEVNSGSIKIGGVDIRDLSLEEYNRKIAYVSQDNYLFDDTIRENIRMGNLNATDEQVEEAAKKCGCHEFIMELTDGYDTIVGGAGGHLSGGERQRISIARAMLKDAPIVILDEATAYTDPENEAMIQSSVAKLVQEKTLIVIAHRLSTIADADKIFVVSDGRVVEEGTHQQLLEKGKIYSKMWKSHISVKTAETTSQKKAGEVYA